MNKPRTYTKESARPSMTSSGISMYSNRETGCVAPACVAVAAVAIVDTARTRHKSVLLGSWGSKSAPAKQVLSPTGTECFSRQQF